MGYYEFLRHLIQLRRNFYNQTEALTDQDRQMSGVNEARKIVRFDYSTTKGTDYEPIILISLLTLMMIT